MRYDTPVYFQHTEQGRYDPTTGDYEDSTVTETRRMANVTSASMETLTLVYGEIRQGAYVVRLQNHYNGRFEYIRIGDKSYKADHIKSLRAKQTFIVSEVQ